MRFDGWFNMEYLRDLRHKIQELDKACLQLAEMGMKKELELAVEHLNQVRHEYHVAQATIQAFYNEPWQIFQNATVEGYLSEVRRGR